MITSFSWKVRLLKTECKIEEKRYAAFKYLCSLADDLKEIVNELQNNTDVEIILLHDYLMRQIKYYQDIAIGMYIDDE